MGRRLPVYTDAPLCDQHLTGSLPTVIKQYEQEAGLGTVRYLVVDREAMAAEFLAALKETGRTAISVLRTDRYGGLDSFTDIGAFVPLRVSRQGDVLRKARPRIDCPSPARTKRAGASASRRTSTAICVAAFLCLRRKKSWTIPGGFDADLDWKERVGCVGFCHVLALRRACKCVLGKNVVQPYTPYTPLFLRCL